MIYIISVWNVYIYYHALLCRGIYYWTSALTTPDTMWHLQLVRFKDIPSGLWRIHHVEDGKSDASFAFPYS